MGDVEHMKELVNKLVEENARISQESAGEMLSNRFISAGYSDWVSIYAQIANSLFHHDNYCN